MNKINLLFILFLFICNNYVLLYAESIDSKIMRAIHTERNTQLDGFMKTLSNSSYIILPAVPVGMFLDYKLCDCKDKLNNSINIASAVVITSAVSLILKEIIKKDRPYIIYESVENIGNQSGYSMPSMHTSTAFSLATSVTMIEPKWYIIVPSYLWATAISYSRIHLGVHTFSDVIVGAILGTTIAFGTNSILKKYK